MLDKLSAVENRFDELNLLLSDPAVFSDQDRYRRLLKEHAELSPLVENIKALRQSKEAIEEHRQLLTQSDDREFRELVRDELSDLETRAIQLEADLQEQLLPKDPNDDRNVIMEIRAGAGGEEAALFAGVLFRMYGAYADSQGWKTELIDASETEIGGFKEVVFMIEGRGAYSQLKFESGVHRVQRVPVTESGGRIHTSAATVAVLPEIGELDFRLDPKDLQIDTYRSSGAGGQKVNKTSSAVRLTHIPTGIVVSSQVERSHFQNLENCKNMLRARLAEIKEREHLEKVSDIKGVQMKIEWGSQIRSYVFMPYQLVKDHRTDYEDGNIDNVMNGDLDGFINAYLTMNAGT